MIELKGRQQCARSHVGLPSGLKHALGYWIASRLVQLLYNLPGSPVSCQILRRMVVVDALSTEVRLKLIVASLTEIKYKYGVRVMFKHAYIRKTV